MSKTIFKKLFFFFILLFSIPSLSQYYNLSNEAKVSILTCGSGDELYSIYGHTAIRFLDTKSGLDVVYNYGNFDFRTPNFYLKFVKGDLQYFAAGCTYQDFMAEYIYDNREVFEQDLNITLIQKQKLFDTINTSLYSDERYYTYKFIDRNCTTMVLEKINKIFGSPVVSKKSNTNVSYRTVLYSYLDNHFFENLGINIIFGKKTDALATKIFLPKELMENLKIATYNNKQIADKIVVLNKKNNQTISHSLWNNFYFFCLFFILMLILNKKWVFMLYFMLLGLIGIFLSFVGFYSFHHEVAQNYNVLLFNPCLLLLIYFYISKNQKWTKYLSYFNLVLLVVYVFIIITKADFVMMLPIILTSGILLFRNIKSNKMLLPSVK